MTNPKNYNMNSFEKLFFPMASFMLDLGIDWENNFEGGVEKSKKHILEYLIDTYFFDYKPKDIDIKKILIKKTNLLKQNEVSLYHLYRQNLISHLMNTKQIDFDNRILIYFSPLQRETPKRGKTSVPLAIKHPYTESKQNFIKTIAEEYLKVHSKNTNNFNNLEKSLFVYLSPILVAPEIRINPYMKISDFFNNTIYDFLIKKDVKKYEIFLFKDLIKSHMFYISTKLVIKEKLDDFLSLQKYQKELRYYQTNNLAKDEIEYKELKQREFDFIKEVYSNYLNILSKKFFGIMENTYDPKKFKIFSEKTNDITEIFVKQLENNNYSYGFIGGKPGINFGHYMPIDGVNLKTAINKLVSYIGTIQQKEP